MTTATKCKICKMSSKAQDQVYEDRKEMSLDKLAIKMGEPKSFRAVIDRHLKNHTSFATKEFKKKYNKNSALNQFNFLMNEAVIKDGYGKSPMDLANDPTSTIEDRANRLLKRAEVMVYNASCLDVTSQCKVIGAAKGLIETLAKVSGQMNDPLKNPQLKKIFQAILAVVSDCDDCGPACQKQFDKIGK